MVILATASAVESITSLFNGPLLAGVGATTDAGLIYEKFHVLPWNPEPKTRVSIAETMTGVTYGYSRFHEFEPIDVATAIKYATYNVDTIFKWADESGKIDAVDADKKARLRADAIAVIVVLLSHGLYGGECRMASSGEAKTIEALPAGRIDDVFNVESLNRAATLILARMHTKYQTNHAIGGNPMQASMASTVRAFYGVSPSDRLTGSAKVYCNFIADVLHWVLHPANETLVIPTVIRGSQIKFANAHSKGPAPIVIDIEEYFQIRSHTPPASTHHFYVCAASLKMLEPLGILEFMPKPDRCNDVLLGLNMISQYGAALHPAARYWGMTRVTANQKLVESLSADLGYAMRKLLPASSLSASPLLAREDTLDSAWKSFIDSLRQAMEEHGREMLDEQTFKSITARVAPTQKEVPALRHIKGFLEGTTNTPAVRAPAEGFDIVPEDDGEGLSRELGKGKAVKSSPPLTTVPGSSYQSAQLGQSTTQAPVVTTTEPSTMPDLPTTPPKPSAEPTTEVEQEHHAESESEVEDSEDDDDEAPDDAAENRSIGA